MDMWTEILSMAVSNGIWAVLFCLLLFYQIKDSRKREIKYQSAIELLTDRLKVVEDIRENVTALDLGLAEVKTIVIRRRKNESTAKAV